MIFSTALVVGLTLAWYQNLPQVEREASELTKSQPSAGNWQKLGLARYLQDRYGPAIEAFEAALQRDPALWSAHLFLGISRYRLNQFAEALRSLERAAQLAPMSAPGRDDVDYWLGATRIALRDPLRGLQALEVLLARNAQHREALQLATETYAEAASGIWNRVAERAFDSGPGQEVHGYALESEGNREGALEAFRRSWERMPRRAGPGVAIGRLALMAGEVEAARTALNRELQNDPASPEAHLYLGLLALRGNQLPQAAASLQKAAQWMPQNEEPLLALSQTYLALGDAVQAVAAARRAVLADGRSAAAHEVLLAALAAAKDVPAAEAEQRRWAQASARR